MMPFGSECCKGSKLLVDLFLESYTRCTSHNGILKNCTVANMCFILENRPKCQTGAYSSLLDKLMANTRKGVQ